MSLLARIPWSAVGGSAVFHDQGRCGWRHNRSTRGASLPVLSYWGERLASLEHPRQIGTELSHDVLNPAHVPL